MLVIATGHTALGVLQRLFLPEQTSSCKFQPRQIGVNLPSITTNNYDSDVELVNFIPAAAEDRSPWPAKWFDNVIMN